MRQKLKSEIGDLEISFAIFANPPRPRDNTRPAMEQTLYYEDYKVGDVRTTHGRTITETDFVVHAGHSGDFIHVRRA